MVPPVVAPVMVLEALALALDKASELVHEMGVVLVVLVMQVEVEMQMLV